MAQIPRRTLRRWVKQGRPLGGLRPTRAELSGKSRVGEKISRKGKGTIIPIGRITVPKQGTREPTRAKQAVRILRSEHALPLTSGMKLAEIEVRRVVTEMFELVRKDYPNVIGMVTPIVMRPSSEGAWYWQIMSQVWAETIQPKLILQQEHELTILKLQKVLRKINDQYYRQISSNVGLEFVNARTTSLQENKNYNAVWKNQWNQFAKEVLSHTRGYAILVFAGDLEHPLIKKMEYIFT